MKKHNTILALSLVVLAASSTAFAGTGPGTGGGKTPPKQPCSVTVSEFGAVSATPSACTDTTKSGSGGSRSAGGLLVGPPVQQPPTKQFCVGSLCFTSPFSGR